MSITVQSATPALLGEIVEAMASWQREGAPVQLHPGDLGWAWRFGAERLAAETRVWRRDEQFVAAGMVDRDAGLIRMALAPVVDADEVFAARLVADLSDPERDVLAAGRACVEARAGTALRGLLRRSGWMPDEAWTPLRRDLTAPVQDCGLTIRTLEADRVDGRIVQDRVAVGRASFPTSRFTVDRWRTMAASPAYRRARCLVAYDRDGRPVAATTVWSAGPGRPGLIEPLGVHRDHRGHGYGRAVTVAAAAALQDLGSSSATVCTPSSNVVGVAAYASAGFERLADVTDYRRPS